MIGGLSSLRALLWVPAAMAAGCAVVLCGRVSNRHLRALALSAAAIGGAVFSYRASTAPMRLLKPAHWGALLHTLGTGTRALGTAALPYDAAAPQPRIALEVLGTELLLASVLVALWPRSRGRTRGYPFLSLALLLVMVASPVSALGGARLLMVGAVLAALCIGFLWLERLPMRPGLGVAALVGVALAGAVPLAARRRPRRPVVRLPVLRGGPGHAGDQTQFNVEPDLRAAPVAARRQRGAAREVAAAALLEGREPRGLRRRACKQRRPGEVKESTSNEVPDDWQTRPGWMSTIQVAGPRDRGPRSDRRRHDDGRARREPPHRPVGPARHVRRPRGPAPRRHVRGDASTCPNPTWAR